MFHVATDLNIVLHIFICDILLNTATDLSPNNIDYLQKFSSWFLHQFHFSLLQKYLYIWTFWSLKKIIILYTKFM
jgi:hypothetical protein